MYTNIYIYILYIYIYTKYIYIYIYIYPLARGLGGYFMAFLSFLRTWLLGRCRIHLCREMLNCLSVCLDGVAIRHTPEKADGGDVDDCLEVHGTQ